MSKWLPTCFKLPSNCFDVLTSHRYPPNLGHSVHRHHTACISSPVCSGQNSWRSTQPCAKPRKLKMADHMDVSDVLTMCIDYWHFCSFHRVYLDSLSKQMCLHFKINHQDLPVTVVNDVGLCLMTCILEISLCCCCNENVIQRNKKKKSPWSRSVLVPSQFELHHEFAGNSFISVFLCVSPFWNLMMWFFVLGQIAGLSPWLWPPYSYGYHWHEFVLHCTTR